MASLRKPHWFFAMLGIPKPRARQTRGIHEFTEAAFKESDGVPPRLREVYDRYKEQKAA